MSDAIKRLLHVGCGVRKAGKLPSEFEEPEWEEVRLDIDPDVQPDIIGDIRDLNGIETGSMDAVYSSHNIEHLYPHEVMDAFREFHRVLAYDGYLLITCPDLKQVARLIAEDKLLDTIYESPAGPIAPIDILFGHRPSLASGNLFMAHKTGFTPKSLNTQLHLAGFNEVRVTSRPLPAVDIWARAYKQKKDAPEPMLFWHTPE